MFLGVAAVVWWYAHIDGIFFVSGLDDPASDLLGPLLPALSAGLIAALAFSLVDAAAGGWAAALSALVVIVLPGFLPLHGSSLAGPPATAFTLLTVAAMLYAPRFSLAYGALAAVTAVFMSTAAVGLPIAAVIWAWLQRHAGNGRTRRALLAVVPLLAAVLIGRFTGDEWSGGVALAWRGHLDDGLRAAGSIIGDQLAPTIDTPALRFFAIADLTLVIGAALVVAWRRIRRLGAFDAINARFHPVLAVTASSLAAGLALRWLLIADSPAPDLAAVFPLVVLAAIATIGSVGILWRTWPGWGKLLAAVILMGWLQAAVRG